jgi:hypothetical protein
MIEVQSRIYDAVAPPAIDSRRRSRFQPIYECRPPAMTQLSQNLRKHSQAAHAEHRSLAEVQPQARGQQPSERPDSFGQRQLPGRAPQGERAALPSGVAGIGGLSPLPRACGPSAGKIQPPLTLAPRLPTRFASQSAQPPQGASRQVGEGRPREQLTVA